MLLDYDFDDRNCFGRCSLVINNPVFLARHFQIRVVSFFQEKLLIPVSILEVSSVPTALGSPQIDFLVPI